MWGRWENNKALCRWCMRMRWTTGGQLLTDWGGDSREQLAHQSPHAHTHCNCTEADTATPPTVTTGDYTAPHTQLLSTVYSRIRIRPTPIVPWILFYKIPKFHIDFYYPMATFTTSCPPLWEVKLCGNIFFSFFSFWHPYGTGLPL